MLFIFCEIFLEGYDLYDEKAVQEESDDDAEDDPFLNNLLKISASRVIL